MIKEISGTPKTPSFPLRQIRHIFYLFSANGHAKNNEVKQKLLSMWILQRYFCLKSILSSCSAIQRTFWGLRKSENIRMTSLNIEIFVMILLKLLLESFKISKEVLLIKICLGFLLVCSYFCRDKPIWSKDLQEEVFCLTAQLFMTLCKCWHDLLHLHAPIGMDLFFLKNTHAYPWDALRSSQDFGFLWQAWSLWL